MELDASHRSVERALSRTPSARMPATLPDSSSSSRRSASAIQACSASRSDSTYSRSCLGKLRAHGRRREHHGIVVDPRMCDGKAGIRGTRVTAVSDCRADRSRRHLQGTPGGVLRPRAAGYPASSRVCGLADARGNPYELGGTRAIPRRHRRGCARCSILTSMTSRCHT